jgi:hypothetical protein
LDAAIFPHNHGVPVCLARWTTLRDACWNAASALAVSDDFLLFLLFIFNLTPDPTSIPWSAIHFLSPVSNAAIASAMVRGRSSSQEATCAIADAKCDLFQRAAEPHRSHKNHRQRSGIIPD